MRSPEEVIIEKKRELSQYLYDKGALWSYKKNRLSILHDTELIEKSLIHLELEEMDMLFDIFPYEKIKQVWIENMVPCDDYYGTLNMVLAYFFFDVKNYRKFRKEVCGKKG